MRTRKTPFTKKPQPAKAADETDEITGSFDLAHHFYGYVDSITPISKGTGQTPLYQAIATSNFPAIKLLFKDAKFKRNLLFNQTAVTDIFTAMTKNYWDIEAKKTQDMMDFIFQEIIAIRYNQNYSTYIAEQFNKIFNDMGTNQNYKRYIPLLQAYLRYCQNNMNNDLTKIFNDKSSTIVETAFQNDSPALLNLLLQYDPEIKPETVKACLERENYANVRLWLLNDFDKNLPILAEAIAAAKLSSDEWKNEFYNLPQALLERFIEKFTITNNYAEDCKKLVTEHEQTQREEYISDKLFSQIHNDRLLSETTLEGNEQLFTSAYLLDLLKRLRSEAYSEGGTQSRLDYARNLDKMIKKIEPHREITKLMTAFIYSPKKDLARKVKYTSEVIMKQFRENGEVLIPGGWMNEDRTGHAMLYEIKRNSHGKLTLLIYNTGAGINYHFKRDENKNVYHASIKAFELNESELNPNDLAKLTRELVEINLRGIFPSKKKEEDDAVTVYKDLAKLADEVGMHEVDPAPYCAEWIKGQNSGTCAWRVYTAFTKNFSYEGQMNYKDLRYEIRYDSIKKYIDKIHLHPSNTGRRQLDFALQNFSLLLADTANDTTEQAKSRREQGLALINRGKIVLKELDDKQATISSEPESKPQLEVKPAVDTNFHLQIPHFYRAYYASESKIEKGKYHVPQTVMLDINDPLATFENGLKICEDLFKTDQYALLANTIEKLYILFPLDLKQRPEKLKLEHSEYKDYSLKFLETVRRLQLLYTSAISKNEMYSFIDRSNILVTGAAISHYVMQPYFAEYPDLSRQQEKELNNLTKFQKKQIYEISCSATISQKRKEVDEYLKIIPTLSDVKSRDIERTQLDLPARALLEIASEATGNPEFGGIMQKDKSFVPNWTVKPGDKDPPEELIKAVYFFQKYPALNTEYSSTNEKLKFYQLFSRITKSAIDFTQEKVAKTDPIKDQWDIVADSDFDKSVNVLLEEQQGKWLVVPPRPKKEPEIKNQDIKLIQPEINDEVFTGALDKLNVESSNRIQLLGLENQLTEDLALKRNLLYTLLRPTTQAHHTIDLMIKEFFRLENKDMQTFCYLSLFRSGLLQQQIIDTPEILIPLMGLVERGLAQHIRGDNISETGLYFFKLACSLQKIIQDMVAENYSDSAHLPEALTKLDKIHNRLNLLITSQNDNTPEGVLKLEKMRTARLMMVCNEVKFAKSATKEQLIHYSQDIAFRKKYGTQRSVDFFIEHNIYQDSYLSEEELRKYLTLNDKNEFLNNILLSAGIQVTDAHSLIWKGSHPFYHLHNSADNETAAPLYSLNLRDGSIVKQGRSYVAIPSELYTNTLYQKFFKEYIPGAFYDSGKKYYEFNYKNSAYRMTAGYGAVLQQLINGSWHLYEAQPLVFEPTEEYDQQKQSNDNLEHVDTNFDSDDENESSANDSSDDEDQTEYLESDFEVEIGNVTNDGFNDFSVLISEEASDEIQAKLENQNFPETVCEFGNSRWVNVNDKSQIIINDATRTHQYVLTDGEIVDTTSISTCDENGFPKNILLSPAVVLRFSEENPWLNRFENNRFIELSKKISTDNLHIEFKRYGLSFEKINIDGNMEWICLQHPQYKINVEPDNLIINSLSGHDSYLHLIPLDKSKKSDLILLPKQLYVLSSEFQDEYRKLEFDKNNIAIDRISNVPLRLSGAESYIALDFNQHQGVIITNPKDHLYLAYLAMSNRDATSALNSLREFFKSSTPIGLEELTWLRRIMQEVPARLTLNAPEKPAKFKGLSTGSLITPELHAVRAAAAYLMTKASLDNAWPDSEKAVAAAKLYGNDYEQQNLVHLDEFRKMFNGEILTCYKDYLSKIDKIPGRMRLSSRHEETILRKLAAEDLPAPIVYRQNELALQFLYTEVQDLIALQGTPKFTASKNERLKELHELIKTKLSVSSRSTQLIESEFILLPDSSLEWISPHNKSLLYTKPASYSYHCAELTDKEFIQHFFHYANIAINGDPNIAKQLNTENNRRLISIANQIIENDSADKSKEKRPLSFADNLRIILAYMIIAPHYFPDINLTPENLPHLVKIVGRAQNISDLALPILNRTMVDNKHDIVLNFNKTLPNLMPVVDKEYSIVEMPDLVSYRQGLQNAIKQAAIAAPLNDDTIHTEQAAKQYINADNSAQLSLTIQEQLILSTAQLASSKTDILNFVNRPPKDETERISWDLKHHSQEMSTLNFPEILHLYLLHDKTLFASKTNLTDSEIEQFYASMTDFLMRATDHQQHEKILAQLTRLATNLTEEETDRAKFEAAKLILQEHNPGIVNEPRMLLFEYVDNKRIYENQYIFMQQMLSTAGNEQGDFENLAQQMIMGGGKSKVLLPIMCLAKATGVNISAIIVPDSLYNIYVADLTSKTQQIANKRPFAFRFDENIKTDTDYLKNLHQSLVNVMVDREYLITTKETVQSLQLNYLRMLLSNDPKEKESREILNSILKLFVNNTDALADEVHAALDVRKELIYTLGDGTKIPETSSEFVIDLYSFFKEVPLPHASTYTMDDVVHEKIRITSEQYDIVKIKLAESLIANSASPLYSISQNLPPQDKNALVNYLLEKEKSPLIDSLPALAQDALALAKQEINQVLKLTLTRNVNEHYGLLKNDDKNHKIPVPYLASNTPSTSQFGNYVEVMNYTAQFYRDALPEYIVKHFVDTHIREMQEEIKLSNSDETFSKRFKELTGWDLVESDYSNPEVFNRFYQDVANNKAVKDFCMLNYIMSDILRNTKTLVSTSQNFAGSFHTFQGMTGTPYNHSTYPLFIKYLKRITDEIDLRVKNNLLKNDNPVLLLDNETNVMNVIPKLLQQNTNPQRFHAWVDIGAYFRGNSNESIAQNYSAMFATLPEMQHIQYLLYFNTDDQLVALPTKHNKLQKDPIILTNTDGLAIQERLNCTPNDYFTFYDQRHIVGTDIKHAPDAIAFVPIGLKTMLHDLLQGVMRMRGLGNGQEIQFIVDKELQSAYPGKTWNTAAIIDFCTNNTNIRLNDDNFKSSLQKMHNVIWSDGLHRILQADIDETRLDICQDFEDIFVTINEKTPYEQYGSISAPTEIEKVLQEYKNKMLSLWGDAAKDITDDLREKISKELDEIIDHAVKNCPAYVENREQEDFGDSQVQVDVQTELQQNTQMETQKEKEQMYHGFNDRSAATALEMKLTDPANNKVDITTIITSKETASGIKPLDRILKASYPNSKWSFSPDIYTTQNAFATIARQKNYLDFTKKEGQLVLVEHDLLADKVRFLIMTTEDAELFKLENISSQGENKRFWIETTHQTPFWGHRSANLPANYTSCREQVAFYAGDTDVLNNTFSDQSWLANQRKAKMEFLHDIILPAHLDKLNLFDRLQEKLNKLPNEPEELITAAVSTPAVKTQRYEEIKEEEKEITPGSFKSSYFNDRFFTSYPPEEKQMEASPKSLGGYNDDYYQDKEWKRIFNDAVTALLLEFQRFQAEYKPPTASGPFSANLELVKQMEICCDNFIDSKTFYLNKVEDIGVFVKKMIYFSQGLTNDNEFSTKLINQFDNTFLHTVKNIINSPDLSKDKIHNHFTDPATDDQLKAYDAIDSKNALHKEMTLRFMDKTPIAVLATVYKYKENLTVKLNVEMAKVIDAETAEKFKYPDTTPPANPMKDIYLSKASVLRNTLEAVDMFTSNKIDAKELVDSLNTWYQASATIPHIGALSSWFSTKLLDSKTSSLISQFKTALETEVNKTKPADPTAAKGWW
jgi:hypothetical protein